MHISPRNHPKDDLEQICELFLQDSHWENGQVSPGEYLVVFQGKIKGDQRENKGIYI